MKVYFSIFLIFVVLYMMFFPVAYLRYAREADAEFSALHLEKAMDYAGEAAMWACLEVADIEAGYTDTEHIIMSPEKAADTFARVMCLSYEIPAGTQNIDAIINKVPVMVLAVNDGYFIAQHQSGGENGEYELKWGLKKAYVVDTDADNTGNGTAYGVDLGLKHWYAVDKQTLSLSEGDDYSEIDMDKEVVFQHINRAVGRDINAAVTRYARELNKVNSNSFFLPVSEGAAGIQRIEKPSLLIVLEDADFDGGRPVDMVSVSGVKVQWKRLVLGWTDAGGRQHCWQKS